VSIRELEPGKKYRVEVYNGRRTSGGAPAKTSRTVWGGVRQARAVERELLSARGRSDPRSRVTERPQQTPGGSARRGAGVPPAPPVDDPLATLSPTAGRVLTAAQRILAERGLSALTLHAVAQESGENKSMTKYYFGNKAGLVAALVDAAVHDECLESASRMQAVTDEDRIARLVRELQSLSEADPGFRAFFDILPHALRNDELRPRLVTLYEWYLELKLDWLGLAGEEDALRRPELRPLAQLLSAVIDGLAIQTLIDPERFDIHAAYAMLQRILAAVLPELLHGQPLRGEAGPQPRSGTGR
jgi:AcrR family transcriptional regulator